MREIQMELNNKAPFTHTQFWRKKRPSSLDIARHILMPLWLQFPSIVTDTSTSHTLIVSWFFSYLNFSLQTSSITSYDSLHGGFLYWRIVKANKKFPACCLCIYTELYLWLYIGYLGNSSNLKWLTAFNNNSHEDDKKAETPQKTKAAFEKVRCIACINDFSHCDQFSFYY